MKLSILSLFVLVLFLSFSTTTMAEDLSPRDIMQKSLSVPRVSDSTSTATMTLTNESGQNRIRKLFSTTKLQENGYDNMRMTRFLSPPDVMGTVTLLIEHSEQQTDDIWIYLPALRKVRRIISSNKKDSFMGSDFSYGDIIGHKINNWTYTLTGEDNVDDNACYVVESLPTDENANADSGYSRRVSWIRKDNFVTVQEKYWDTNDELLKIASFKNFRLVDKTKMKWIPLLLLAENVQSGHTTSIEIDDLDVNQGVKTDLFTTRYMERGK